MAGVDFGLWVPLVTHPQSLGDRLVIYRKNTLMHNSWPGSNIIKFKGILINETAFIWSAKFYKAGEFSPGEWKQDTHAHKISIGDLYRMALRMPWCPFKIGQNCLACAISCFGPCNAENHAVISWSHVGEIIMMSMSCATCHWHCWSNPHNKLPYISNRYSKSKQNQFTCFCNQTFTKLTNFQAWVGRLPYNPIVVPGHLVLSLLQQELLHTPLTTRDWNSLPES